jgi:poly(A) polymerase
MIQSQIIEYITDISVKCKTDAFIVGGFVRDKLLGTESTDLDFMIIGDAVEFAEKVAKSLNKKLDAVYKKFGTALLNIDGHKIEFASARKESYRKNSRKPDIEFSNLKDDLSRRDFTVNALAISLKDNSKIIDYFNGQKDLKNKLLRTPLDPEKTFFDDPLRIMRAVRFASKLEFSIEEKTFEGMIKFKSRLKEDEVVSQERITNEFILILETRKPSVGLNLLYLSGILEIIFPELAYLVGVEQRQDYHHKDAFFHTLEVVDNVAQKSNDIWLRFAALVHDIAKPKTKKFIQDTGWTFHGHDELGARMMKKIFIRMKLPLNKLDYIEKLVRLHLRPIPLAEPDVTDSAFRRLAVDAGENLEDLLTLCRADITSKNPEKQKRFFKNYERVEKRIVEVQEKDKLRNFQSPVDGNEIMKICNLTPSRAVGIIKKKIEDAILDGIIPNEYESAKEYLYKIKDAVLKK